MKLWIRCTALVALTAGAAAFVASTRPAAAARTSPERLASGERVYLTSCAMCHGPSGNGDGPLAEQLAKESGTHPARLNDAARLKQLGRAGVYRVIVEGGGHTQRSNLMPPWGEKLGPVLADDVTDYVMNFASRGPSAPPSATIQKYLKAPPGVPEKGRQVFVYICSACHGLTGVGDGPYARTLRIRHKVWPRNLTQTAYFAKKTDQELFVTISLGGGHVGKSPMMPAWAVSLSPEEIKDLVAYIRVLSKTQPRP